MNRHEHKKEAERQQAAATKSLELMIDALERGTITTSKDAGIMLELASVSALLAQSHATLATMKEPPDARFGPV